MKEFCFPTCSISFLFDQLTVSHPFLAYVHLAVIIIHHFSSPYRSKRNYRKKIVSINFEYVTLFSAKINSSILVGNDVIGS